MFNYRFEEDGPGKLLSIIIEGEFDTGGAQVVQDALEPFREKEITRIIFDLSGATLMASSGLRVIFYAKDRLKDSMAVELRGATGLVARVIHMSGIGKFVEVR